MCAADHELMILYIKVLLAYSFTWDATVEGRPLMYNKNKRGPRTKPYLLSCQSYCYKKLSRDYFAFGNKNGLFVANMSRMLLFVEGEATS